MITIDVGDPGSVNVTDERVTVQVVPRDVVTVQLNGVPGPPGKDGLDFADTGWFPFQMLNGWTGGNPYPAYCRVGNVVHIKGEVYNGTAQIFSTLPSGFRPSESGGQTRRNLPIVAKVGTGGTFELGHLGIVNSTGQVSIKFPHVSTAGNTYYIDCVFHI